MGGTITMVKLPFDATPLVAIAVIKIRMEDDSLKMFELPIYNRSKAATTVKKYMDDNCPGIAYHVKLHDAIEITNFKSNKREFITYEEIKQEALKMAIKDTESVKIVGDPSRTSKDTLKLYKHTLTKARINRAFLCFAASFPTCQCLQLQVDYVSLLCIPRPANTWPLQLSIVVST